jgi:hypothetical protein
VITPELNAETLSVTVSGSGDVELGEVKAGQVRFKISGSGDVRVQNARADEIHLNLRAPAASRRPFLLPVALGFDARLLAGR